MLYLSSVSNVEETVLQLHTSTHQQSEIINHFSITNNTIL